MIDGSKGSGDQGNVKLRWLVAVTGLVAVSSLAITTIYSPLPAMLIGGAAIVGKWPRTGRWLMWISASVLSVCVLPVYVVLLLHPGGRFFYSDIWLTLGNFGWIGTVVLLPICDVLLLIDVFKRRAAPQQTA